MLNNQLLKIKRFFIFDANSLSLASVIKFELLPSSLKAQVFFFKAEKKKGL
jgi:hypothetical protein